MIKRNWSRRIYELNNKEIYSDEVIGFLHKARFEKECMMYCGEPIKKGENYILFNTYGGEPMHVNCFVVDGDEPLILGIRIYKKKSWYGIMKTHVICKKWSPPFDEAFYISMQSPSAFYIKEE